MSDPKPTPGSPDDTVKVINHFFECMANDAVQKKIKRFIQALLSKKAGGGYDGK